MAALKLCLVVLSVFCISFCLAENVDVSVRAAVPVAQTDDNYICATMDWWPSDKCDYGQCPWGQSSVLNLDLNNTILGNAIKAFNPLRIRVGGSLQDLVVYQVGNAVKKFPHFKKRPKEMFTFSRGTLTMERWDQLNALFKQTNAKVTFGLNALFGKKRGKHDPKVNPDVWVGDWNPDNARDFIAYSISKGYEIDSYDFGNELVGGQAQSAQVLVEQYGKDMIALKKLLTELHPDPSSRPKVVGPAGFFDKEFYTKLLQVSGPGVIDGVTHHMYNLGSGNSKKLIENLQDPFFLSKEAHTFRELSNVIDKFGPWAGAWVGESGGAYNSGGKNVSNTFVDGFWYLDQLGMASFFNHKVYCRQSFIGGNYPFLDTTNFIPNPDYYGALLWHRLMGPEVLQNMIHTTNPYLRVYTHCHKRKKHENPQGTIAVLLINMSNSTSFDVSMVNDVNFYSRNRRLLDDNSVIKQREEYHLTPKDGDIQSRVVLLNGTPLLLTSTQDIPPMEPKHVDPSTPISVAPDSIVFATVYDFHAPACL